MAESLSSLVEIQPDGSKLPLFCMHDCSGEVRIYEELACHFAPERPVYALRAQGIHGEKHPHNRYSDMAACYIKEMQIVQPEGPYLLAGSEAGGFIALEVAQQLLAQGHEMALLVVMDTIHSAPSRGGSIPGKIFGKYYWKFAYSFIAQRVGFIRRHIDYIKCVKRALWKAERSYSPKSYPGQVLYFLSEGRRPGFREAEWQKMAIGGIEVRTIPGLHGDMLNEPNAEILAEQLKAFLDERLEV